ncbi:MAG: DUF1588 domain-containing protein [Proteobacteria bacterium]|nr:DUF1588 domain-containing protein [Pseudomonadota bacterium]
MTTSCRVISLISLLALLTVSQVGIAGRSTLENGYLYIPRIDVDGFGAMELTFRIVFDDEYLLLLEEAVATSTAIANSGVFDPLLKTIEVDEVELETGERFAVQLSLLSQDGQAIFTITDAVNLNAPAATDPDPDPEAWQRSAAQTAIYTQQCSGCHGIDGAGSSSGPSLIACANCATSSALSNLIRDTMPLGLPGACDSTCATQLADFIIGSFNASNHQLVVDTIGFIELLGNGETLRKASRQLVSRLPQIDEFRMVSAGGTYGLRQAIDGMMEEDSFFQRLTEIFNDYLLTDKYHSRNGSEAALRLLSNDDFPNRRWFDPDSDNRPENYETLRRQTNDAVAREPLELINHVVRNNLPFTEIVTADYMLMSPFSARSFGVENIGFEDTQDPAEYKPGRLADIPHAGILTSPMFLNRYPTTSTNRNRGRASVVFDLFLDTDILAIEGVRPGNAVDITTPIPTINNPQCAKCHSVLDPVASIFQNWDYKGRYRPARLNDHGWYTDMEPRGFNGQPMPLAGNVDSSLQWLGQKIAADPKFPRAVTRIMVNGLTGKEPLRAPLQENVSQAETDAYVAERTLLNDIQARFVADNYNLKTLVREIMMSPYWRAAGINGNGNIQAHALTGSSYLFTPEQLDRKIKSLLGFDWRRSLDSYYKDVNNSWASMLTTTYHQIYGGIDSDSVITRLTSPNGLMGAMQLRMANELACYAVPHDFWLPPTQRRLFLFVDQETNPYNEAGVIDSGQMTRIRQNIQYLHEYLLGEILDSASPELQATEELFMSALNRGRQIILAGGGQWYDVRLPDSCDRTRDFQGNDLRELNGEDQRLQEDRQYVVRAWMAVVAYLLADYKFFYG